MVPAYTNEEVMAIIEQMKCHDLLAAPAARCACCPEGLLDSFTGGAAPEGLFGRVTLLINGQRVDYVPASQPVKAQPLTDEQASSLWREHLRVSDLDGASIHGGVALIRAVERAHRIGQGVSHER